MKPPTLHPRKIRWLTLLGLSLVGGLMIRGLDYGGYGTTALVYLGLPWLVAVILTLTARFETDPEEQGETTERGSVVRRSLIVMLGSSFLLGEGFICIVMFLPIYLFVVILVAVADYFGRKRAAKGSKLHQIHLFPLLIALFALEGTHPDLSFERQSSATVQQVTSIGKEQLWANLREPMVLNRAPSSGLSKLFPQPVQIDIDTFELGAVHKVHYRYARWLWTNVHEGTLELRIIESTNNAITAEVVNNSSYLANYLDIERIRLTITDQPAGSSEVAIRIEYKRTLDPAWYFAPLMRLALEGTASHIIQTHILKEGEDND